MALDNFMGMTVTLLLMFFGALGAGYIPYFINVRESRVQLMSALGGGLLLGSALAVVIPEGFHAFHEVRNLSTLQPAITEELGITNWFSCLINLQIGSGGHDHDAHTQHDEHEHVTAAPASGLTGLALVGGFLVMLLLDQLQAGADGHSHGVGHHHHIGHTHCPDTGPSSGEVTTSSSSVADPFSAALKETDGLVSGHVIPTGTSTGKGKSGGAAGGSSSADRAVLGLLVHCASDGLALGSAFLSGNTALSFVVGTAMVLHKAPMAFGLTAYLQTCRWPWAKAQRTLILFAATAPASSLLTFTLLSTVPLFTTPTAVSLAILFSGGTFLHAATMHILPDVVANTGHLNTEQLGAVAVGCVLPALLSWGHHH